MKKIGILLAILLVAGVCAMADEATPAQDDVLFAEVDAVALSQAEMEVVDGGYDPDAGGNNWRYSARDVKKTAEYISKGDPKDVVKVVIGVAIGGRLWGAKGVIGAVSTHLLNMW